MRRFKFGATGRFIPAGATKVADRKSDAVAYVYTTAKDRPAFVMYYGKQSKPVAHFSCKDQAQLERDVAKYFAGRQAYAAMTGNRKAERQAPNQLETGDIVVASWGYDQTNVDFYEVTEVAGQYVTLRKIAATSAGADMSGRCVPQSGQFIGEPMRKLVQFGDRVTIDQSRHARKWNTSKVAGVPVGPTMYWSSYH